MQEQKYPINQWAKDDRPREKLLLKGSAHLTNSELIAILIQYGTRDRTAIDLAQDILKAGKDDLLQLGRMGLRDLMKIKGIGEAKAITIVAALELGRRRSAALPAIKTVITNSTDVAGYLQHLLRDYQHEVFAVIFLNRANKINHFQIISEGGITGTVADPRLILKKALV
jgi:DNA repair protein RadC